MKVNFWRLWVLIYVLGLSAAVRAGASSQDPQTASTPSQGAQSQKPQPQPKIAPRKETVVVTGTFEPLPVESVDRSVSVIDTRESPLLFNHWVDYLQLDPSIDLQERAPNGVQADLTIRGSTFGQTLVLLDGLRMNDVQSAHHDMDVPLPSDAIERIEVLRGAGSTFYGSDAVGGTINLITGPPKYSEFRVGAEVGNFGVNEQSMSAAFLSGKWDEQLSAARDFSSGFMPDRDYRSITAFSNTGVETALGRTLLLVGYGDKPFGANQFYGNFNSWELTRSWFAGLKQELGRLTEFDFGYRRHTDEFVLFRDNPSFYTNDHVDDSWQAALRRKQPLGSNSTVFYGAEGFYDSIVSNNLGQHQRSRAAIYLDYDMRALGRFSFSAGAREEFYDSTPSQFTPSVSAGMWIKEGWKLKGSASRAFRLPTYTDLYYSDPANQGNPNLKPEIAWSYEGGLLWDRGGRYDAQVTVFERREKNDIDYVRSSPADKWQATNIGKLDFTGVEASLEARLPHRQRLQVSNTAIHGTQAALMGLESQYVFNYPIDDAVVSWQGMLPGRFVARSRVGVLYRYARDPYALWDVAVAREFPHVAAHLGLSNLTNTQYQEVQGVDMPGRSVVFGLEFSVAKKGR